MIDHGPQFYFDKTDLFNRIKRLEGLIGIDDTDFTETINKINNIEQTLNTINANYTTRTYVDNNLIAKVNKVGDTLLGNLALLETPIDNNHIVTKEYVDNIVAGIKELDLTLIATKAYVDAQNNNLSTNITTQIVNKVSKFGDVLYGELILSDNATQPLHPVTKQQFDASISTVAQIGNLDW